MNENSNPKPLPKLSREELNAQLDTLNKQSKVTDNRRSFFGRLIALVGVVLGVVPGCKEQEPQVLCYVCVPEQENENSLTEETKFPEEDGQSQEKDVKTQE